MNSLVVKSSLIATELMQTGRSNRSVSSDKWLDLDYTFQATTDTPATFDQHFLRFSEHFPSRMIQVAILDRLRKSVLLCGILYN